MSNPNSRARYWIVAALLVLVSALGIAATQVDLPLGAIDGVEEGMGQTETLRRLAQIGVDGVVPAVGEAVVVRGSNLDEIPELMRSEGICISDNAGLAMNLELGKDGAVKTLYASDPAASQFGIVNSYKEVEALLRSVLPKKEGLVAGRCVPNARWVSLLTTNEADSAYLLRQAAWRYRRPRSYSWVTVEFAEGKVTRIAYRWQPFEG